MPVAYHAEAVEQLRREYPDAVLMTFESRGGIKGYAVRHPAREEVRWCAAIARVWVCGKFVKRGLRVVVVDGRGKLTISTRPA